MRDSGICMDSSEWLEHRGVRQVSGGEVREGIRGQITKAQSAEQGCLDSAMGSHWKVLSKEVMWSDLHPGMIPSPTVWRLTQRASQEAKRPVGSCKNRVGESWQFLKQERSSGVGEDGSDLRGKVYGMWRWGLESIKFGVWAMGGPWYFLLRWGAWYRGLYDSLMSRDRFLAALTVLFGGCFHSI